MSLCAVGKGSDTSHTCGAVVPDKHAERIHNASQTLGIKMKYRFTEGQQSPKQNGTESKCLTLSDMYLITVPL